MPRVTKIALITGCVVTLLLLAGFGLWQLMKSRTFQLFGGLTNRVTTQNKVVALTFDDGPTPGYTDEILATLAKEEVTATFMLIGREIHQHPGEAKKIVAAGHQIGNHSYTHQRMVLKPASFYQTEIEQTDAEIRNAGYTGEIVFRPPYGKKLYGLPHYLSAHERKTVTWDVEPESDSKIASSTEAIVRHTVDNTKPGSIILLHSMYSTGQKSRNAIGPIIRQLKAKGYTFVNITNLLAHK